MDESLLKAMNYPLPSDRMRSAVEGIMRMRACVLRVLPHRKTPRLLTLEEFPSHPGGYSVEDVGPKSLREKWSRQ